MAGQQNFLFSRYPCSGQAICKKMRDVHDAQVRGRVEHSMALPSLASPLYCETE